MSRLVDYTLSILYDELERAKSNALQQMVLDARNRVKEEVAAEGLTPISGLVIRVTAERWVADGGS